MAPTLSVAVTVKENVPTLVGSPLSTPPVARLKPVGRAPAVMAKVYGPPAPPVSAAPMV